MKLQCALLVPLNMVSLLAYDRGQFLPILRGYVDHLPHCLGLRRQPSDLHLLDDHHQEQGKNDDSDQKRPEPEPESWPSIL
jgi:hypothetical protein